MILYQDNTEMKVGDSVLIERGRTPGTISGLIHTTAEMQEWNVDEPGVFIKSPVFGLVFLPASSFDDEPIIFVCRGRP